jgi:hypothetical protein
LKHELNIEPAKKPAKGNTSCNPSYGTSESGKVNPYCRGKTMSLKEMKEEIFCDEKMDVDGDNTRAD